MTRTHSTAEAFLMMLVLVTCDYVALTLLKEKADNLKLKHLKHVFKPLTRGYALKPESYIDVGFDTEYTSEDDSSKKTLLTLQFSLGVGTVRCIKSINSEA